MSKTAILLISEDGDLLNHLQSELADAEIAHTDVDHLPLYSPPIVIIDCLTISPMDIQHIVQKFRGESSIVAILEEAQLQDYGALFLKTGTLILNSSLDNSAIVQIRQLYTTIQAKNPSQNADTITLKFLAHKFAEQSPDPLQLIQVIADAVRDSMHADLVILVRMEADSEGQLRSENLAVSYKEKQSEEQPTQDILRPGRFTERIIKTAEPIIIRDAVHFELNDLRVNPDTIAWGFKTALGLPLMQGEKTFGAMWVLYRQIHLFSEKDFLHLQIHASHAALAYSYPLQKKLADQWRKATQTIFARLDAQDTFETTMQKITDGIHESLDCQVVTLYVYHPQWEHFDLPYQKGAKFPEALHEKETVLSDSIVYDMLKETEPLAIENVPESPLLGQTNFAKREQIRSTVILPLHRGSEAVGVVFINFHEKRTFSADERQAISVLGGQIASSILNARLDEERQQTVELANNLLKQATEQRDYIRSMMKFIDIERDIMQKDSAAILRTIARDTCKAAGANRVTIRLIDGEQEKALAKFPPDTAPLTGNLPDVDAVIRQDGHSQLIMRTNEPIVIPNINFYKPEDYGGIELNPNVVQRWQARVGLPLTSGRRSIGVMWISYKEPRSFSPSQLQAFQSFANMAFFTKTYETMRERLQRALEILHQAHQEISVNWTLDDILLHTRQLASQLVSDSDDNPNYHSHIALVEDDKLRFHPKHNSPEVYHLLNQILDEDVSLELDADTPGIVVQAALNATTQSVKDASKETRFVPLFTKQKQGSQISIPIMVGDRVFAVVSVEHPKPNTFEWYDHATLEALASYVGQVINNNLQQKTLADLFDKERIHNESLLVLANAAMEQVVKSHDFGNFRGVYDGNMPEILGYVRDLAANKDQILSSVDKETYKSLKTAVPDLITRVDRIDQIYQQRIVQSSKSPELGDRKTLAVREWIFNSFHNDMQIDLDLDDSVDENLFCEIPAYWLREVSKNLILNASRAIKAADYSDLSKQQIQIQARYYENDGQGRVQISVSNYGQPIPEAISQLLIKQVIPRSIRDEYGGGRGIGLFMCGLILDVYDGQIEYQAQGDYNTFVLRLPAFR